jgi:ribosomal protein L29
MKLKDKKELHAKSINELKKLIIEAKDALSALRMDKTLNKLKNTRQLFIKGKEIARMLTIVRMKELALLQMPSASVDGGQANTQAKKK